MRVAGSLIQIDPTAIPLYGDRYAGQVIKEQPELVNRITAAMGVPPVGQLNNNDASAHGNAGLDYSGS